VSYLKGAHLIEGRCGGYCRSKNRTTNREGEQHSRSGDTTGPTHKRLLGGGSWSVVTRFSKEWFLRNTQGLAEVKANSGRTGGQVTDTGTVSPGTWCVHILSLDRPTTLEGKETLRKKELRWGGGEIRCFTDAKIRLGVVRMRIEFISLFRMTQEGRAV